MSADQTAPSWHISDAAISVATSPLRSGARDNRRRNERRASDKRTQLLAHLAAELINLEPRPLLIVDSDLNILLVNEAATRLLRSTDAVRSENRKLAFADLRHTKQLARAFERDQPTCHINVGLRDGRAQVRVNRCSLAHLRTATWIVRIDALGMKCDCLQSALGLTRAEAEIALALIEGRSLMQISKERETSINTVKTQTRFVFQKCRTHTRADLIRRLHEVLRPNP